MPARLHTQPQSAAHMLLGITSGSGLIFQASVQGAMETPHSLDFYRGGVLPVFF
jgi:hypothetical protein